MSRVEAIIGSGEADPNLKASASLAFGLLAIANVVAVSLLMVFNRDFFDGLVWVALPMAGFAFGIVALFLGSTGWIDARRGAAGQRLRQAQFGAVLGGIATLFVIAAIVAVLVLVVQALGDMANAANGLADGSLD